MNINSSSSSSRSGGGGSSGVGGSSGDGGGSGSGSGGGSPCGACKFLRRKCVQDCIFAPYFDSEQGATHFAAVHKVFGASNVSKLLLNIPKDQRLVAVVTICYEAQARLRDPIYGCISHIYALQQQVVTLQAELSCLQGHLATLDLPPPPPPQPPPQATIAPPVIPIGDLPTAPATTVAASYDLSSLFDPMGQTSSWPMQHRPIEPPRQYLGSGTSLSNVVGADLQVLARELSSRHGSNPTAPVASSNPSSSQSLSK
ncbi:hypothetical protein VNO77_07121 [Canavalia gladiata]|uniref:LOB domain-containing protein n=1 Tax=Canavalia gladiata TaxID=3824 RepID=A0AAN9M8A9_CANGL